MATELNVYVAVFLFRGRQVLLLRRGDDRRFAPGRWTGVGGRVEAEEMSGIEAAALREVTEETGIGPHEVTDFQVRVVLTQPESGGISVLAFCTGRTDRAEAGPCGEGSLCWVDVDRVGDLGMIENAARALDLAMQAMADGKQGVRFGVCAPGPDGTLAAWTLAPDWFHLNGGECAQ